jgi:hypothetical protein
MEESQQQCENDPDYQHLANDVLQQHSPALTQTLEVGEWPDEVPHRELVVRDRDTDEAVGKLSFGVSSDGQAELIMPADYTEPMAKEPFTSIDDPETLPPAGELIYEIVEVVHWIIVSPYEELTEIRKVAALLERLHQHHDYSPDTIETGLVQAAQKRGDLPVSFLRLLD